MRYRGTAIALASILAGGCSFERPGYDIGGDVARALSAGRDYEIRPRSLSRFDCLCVVTAYEDDARTTMAQLARSPELGACAVRNVPIDLDDGSGAFLLADRSTRPAGVEIQSFDRGAAPALVSLTTLYRGCQRANRARISARPGHSSLEVFLQ